MVRTLADAKKAAALQTKPTKKGKATTKTNDAGSSSQGQGSREAEGKPKIVRMRPGMRALREIREYQANTELLLKKASFQRLVRGIATKINPSLRFEVQALLALHEAAEMFMVGHFEDASICCAHGRRVTIMERDLVLSKRLRTKASAGSQHRTAVSGGRATAAGSSSGTGATPAKRARSGKKEDSALPTDKTSESPAARKQEATAMPTPGGAPLALLPPTVPAAEARGAAETQAVASTVQDDEDEDEDDEDYLPDYEDVEEGDEEDGEEEEEDGDEGEDEKGDPDDSAVAGSPGSPGSPSSLAMPASPTLLGSPSFAAPNSPALAMPGSPTLAMPGSPTLAMPGSPTLAMPGSPQCRGVFQ